MCIFLHRYVYECTCVYVCVYIILDLPVSTQVAAVSFISFSVSPNNGTLTPQKWQSFIIILPILDS